MSILCKVPHILAYYIVFFSFLRYGVKGGVIKPVATLQVFTTAALNYYCCTTALQLV